MEESGVPFHRVGPQDRTQVVWLGSERSYPPDHLATPFLFLKIAFVHLYVRTHVPTHTAQCPWKAVDS